MKQPKEGTAGFGIPNTPGGPEGPGDLNQKGSPGPARKVGPGGAKSPTGSQAPTPTQALVGPQPGPPSTGSPVANPPISSPGGDMGSPVTTPPSGLPGGDMGGGGGITAAPAFGLSGATSGTSTSSGTAPAQGGLTDTQSSAKATITDFLGTYGLGSLGDWAWGQYLNGTPLSQLMLDLRSRPEYKARFPAMDALGKQGRAITESQYVNYETNAKSIMRAAGLPEGFYDQPEDFTKLLTGGVALPELQARVQDYQTAVFSSPPEVLNALRDTYNIDPGQLTAFFIDPDRALPLIQKQWASSQAIGYGQQMGLHLNQSQAEGIGGLGLSTQQLQGGLNQVAGFGNVTENMPGQQQGVSTDQALSAVFSNNAKDQAAVDARRRNLANQFGGGGGVAATQRGVTGAGVAQ